MILSATISDMLSSLPEECSISHTLMYAICIASMCAGRNLAGIIAMVEFPDMSPMGENYRSSRRFVDGREQGSDLRRQCDRFALPMPNSPRQQWKRTSLVRMGSIRAGYIWNA